MTPHPTEPNLTGTAAGLCQAHGIAAVPGGGDFCKSIGGMFGLCRERVAGQPEQWECLAGPPKSLQAGVPGVRKAR